MPFDLFITSTEGRTFKSMRSPYPDREAARRTVVVSVADSLHSCDTERESSFADRVITAPLGETVVHEPTGIAFRTEESA